jgi:hypothetical protein
MDFFIYLFGNNWPKTYVCIAFIEVATQSTLCPDINKTCLMKVRTNYTHVEVIQIVAIAFVELPLNRL